MKSGTQKPAPVTALERMCGNAFALTRNGGELQIRKLPRPAPKDGRQLVLPFPERKR